MSNEKPVVASEPKAFGNPQHPILEAGCPVWYASEIPQQGDLHAVVTKVTGSYVNLTVFQPTGTTHGVTMIRHDPQGWAGTWRFKSEKSV